MYFQTFVNVNFAGVIQGIHMSTVQQLFSFLQPLMGSMVDLLGLFHNYPNIVELILELFCEAAKRCLCYLGQTDSRILYQHSVAVIRMYAHHNQVMMKNSTVMLKKRAGSERPNKSAKMAFYQRADITFYQ